MAKESRLYHIALGSARALLREIIQALDAAKEIVLFQSFFLDKWYLTDKLAQIADRGVQVYGLLARLGVKKEQAKSFTQLTENWAGRVLVRLHPHFHAKYLLSDPHLDIAKGYLFTANLNLTQLSVWDRLGA